MNIFRTEQLGILWPNVGKICASCANVTSIDTFLVYVAVSKISVQSDFTRSA